MKLPRLALALDIVANAFALGRHVQTLSKRAAQAKAKGKLWGHVFCAVVDFFDPGHSARALLDREQGY